eukprot:s900_g1.t1
MGLVIPETIESLWQFGEQAVLHLADRERQLLLTVEGNIKGLEESRVEADSVCFGTPLHNETLEHISK